MSRTLTAAPTPLPAETAALGPDAELMALLNDPETRFFEIVDRLFEQGEYYRRIVAKLKTDPAKLPERIKALAAQLADADLIAKHPQDAKKATLRLEAWCEANDALAGIEAEARTLRGWLAHCWQQLPQRRRKELQESPDFPRSVMAVRVAGEAWERARQGRGIPGRCPFALIGAVATMAMGVIA